MVSCHCGGDDGGGEVRTILCGTHFGAYISYIRSSHTKKKFVVKIISISTLIAVEVRTIFQTPRDTL